MYDVDNRLPTASPEVTLTYDPLGHLHRIAGTAGTAGSTIFLYDGDALVAEYDAAGALTRRHVHSVGADVPVVSYEGVSLAAPRYLFADHQGSIVARSDANGIVTEINRYDEYGIPGSTNTGTFQYTGQVWLPELGMYHYKARVYSPTLGRFLQVDPVGYDGGFNLYAYVLNDPVNVTDPDGKNPAIDGRVAGLMSLSPAEDLLLGAWLGRTVTTTSRSGSAARSAGRIPRSQPVTDSRVTGGRPGSKGAPDHQADVHGPGQRQAEAQARPGEQVVTEGRVRGHPGVNRRPDNQVVGTDGRTRLVVESERRPDGAYHRAREAEYRRNGIQCQTRRLCNPGE